MMSINNLISRIVIVGVIITGLFLIEEGVNLIVCGAPVPWSVSFQSAGSYDANLLFQLYSYVMTYLYGIFGFVLVIFLITIYKFSRKNNRISYNRFNHGSIIEFIWTIIPVIILVLIAIPSFSLLYLQELYNITKADLNIKVKGNQWFWNYSYTGLMFKLIGENNINNDLGEKLMETKSFGFDSYMIQEEDLLTGYLRLLEVDKPLIVPVNKDIKFEITSVDVIHGFAVPSLGIKMDALPGRVNEVFTHVERPGVFYGQCSELCGELHQSMPIKVIGLDESLFKFYIHNILLEDISEKELLTLIKLYLI